MTLNCKGPIIIKQTAQQYFHMETKYTSTSQKVGSRDDHMIIQNFTDCQLDLRILAELTVRLIDLDGWGIKNNTFNGHIQISRKFSWFWEGIIAHNRQDTRVMEISNTVTAWRECWDHKIHCQLSHISNWDGRLWKVKDKYWYPGWLKLLLVSRERSIGMSNWPLDLPNNNLIFGTDLICI